MRFSSPQTWRIALSTPKPSSVAQPLLVCADKLVYLDDGAMDVKSVCQ